MYNFGKRGFLGQKRAIRVGSGRVGGQLLNSEKSSIFVAPNRGEVQEWLNWPAWKASKRQKRFRGSNPLLSAKREKDYVRPLHQQRFFVCIGWLGVYSRSQPIFTKKNFFLRSLT